MAFVWWQIGFGEDCGPEIRCMSIRIAKRARDRRNYVVR